MLLPVKAQTMGIVVAFAERSPSPRSMPTADETGKLHDDRAGKPQPRPGQFEDEAGKLQRRPGQWLSTAEDESLFHPPSEDSVVAARLLSLPLERFSAEGKKFGQRWACSAGEYWPAWDEKLPAELGDWASSQPGAVPRPGPRGQHRLAACGEMEKAYPPAETMEGMIADMGATVFGKRGEPEADLPAGKAELAPCFPWKNQGDGSLS